MKSHKAATETDSLEESKSAIEQSIEGLMRATNAYVYMLLVLGAMPWRAGRIANDKTGVISFSATFLFASSFILSLVLGAAVEFWRLFDFDQLPNIALNEVRIALEPEFAKAIVSLFPGIICAEASAWLVARIVSGNPATREQMRRFVLLAFALQFQSDKDAFLFHANAAVLDWQAGSAPVMMVPAGAAQWVILQTAWPSNICASNELSTHGEWTRVHVEAEEAFSERRETFDSEPTMFCALR
jgi:hypothetical protein